MYPSPGKRVAVLAALIVAVVGTDSRIGYAQGVGARLTGEAVRARANAQRDIALKLFRRFLTLPNHSAHAEDIKRPVAWMEPQFAVRGFQTWRIETEGSTVLFAERSFPGAEKSSAVIDTVKSAQELLHTLDSKKKQLIAHGGTILLETGRYGVVDIRDIAPAKRIRIAAAEGATPEFVHIRVLNAEKITLDGLSVIAVRPSHERYAGRWRRHLLEVLGSKEVHLLNMYVASARDTSKWSKEDWLENVLNGVFIRGSSHTIVKDSLFENVFNGMTDYRGSDNLFEDNTVREFAGDGIRAIGQNGTFKGNHVTDCIKVNENHDDGIQSWAYGPKGRPGNGELVGLKILNNKIELGQTPHPLRCPHMQGLGFFDGFWRDLVIDGNTIIVDHWHGIAVFGARDSVIRNNVVRYKRSPSPELTHNGPKNTWIKVGPHKDGRPSERVVIENNEAAHYDIDGKDMVFRNNRHN